MRRWALVVFACMMACGPGFAADKEEALYDVIFDMDQNKVRDRAVLVLVGPGRRDFSDLTKDRYVLEEGERVDLFIYLNSGDGPIDLAKPPTVRKEKIMSWDELSFVLPLTVNSRGSLQVVASNGFGNTFNTSETVTLVHRNGAVHVAGFARDFYNSRDDVSLHCSINYLTGKAVTRDNDGKDIVSSKRFKPVALDDWKADEASASCEAME
jgi:hypothetical protein